MAIVVDSVPTGTRGPGQIGQDQFPQLKRNDSLTLGNLGGKFSLPSEFDATRFASGFYREGQEASSMEADQPVLGAPYMSEGWQVWKYPQKRPTGRYAENGQPIEESHPLAGKPHKVVGDKPDQNFVLMFRSAEVQSQVNHAYGLTSIEQMTREQRGETLSGDAGGGDPGMLSNARLNRVLGPEPDIDRAEGRSTAVHAEHPSGRIERKDRNLSK